MTCINTYTVYFTYLYVSIKIKTLLTWTGVVFADGLFFKHWSIFWPQVRFSWNIKALTEQNLKNHNISAFFCAYYNLKFFNILSFFLAETSVQNLLKLGRANKDYQDNMLLCLNPKIHMVVWMHTITNIQLVQHFVIACFKMSCMLK